MRTAIEAQFSCSILDWNLPEDDFGAVRFSAYVGGELLVADSLALLISALQEREPYPLLLAA
jgi:hypothetical protein